MTYFLMTGYLKWLHTELNAADQLMNHQQWIQITEVAMSF